MNWLAALWQKVFPPRASAGVDLRRRLKGTRYPWEVIVDGDDLLVQDVRATWFGGQADKDSGQDSGETSSGINTIESPGYLGCALPMDLHRSHDNPCAGSPLSELPWFMPVEVTNRANGRKITVKAIDLGPSPPPKANAALDLTRPAFLALGGVLKTGAIRVDYRIKGGARYV
jgi:hypothetical protein